MQSSIEYNYYIKLILDNSPKIFFSIFTTHLFVNKILSIKMLQNGELFNFLFMKRKRNDLDNILFSEENGKRSELQKSQRRKPKRTPKTP
jgi:hypothetical protein